MKIFLFLVFGSLLHFTSIGQDATDIQSLVAAEKKFARLSADSGTKSAFLENLSAAGILFKPIAVNGVEFWQKQPADNSMLLWQPVFADVSAAGDIGYTTGPFQQYRDKSDTVAVGRGSYVSIWEKENGVWKVVLDIGIGHPPGPIEEENFKKSTSSTKPSSRSVTGIKEIESEFILQQATKGWKAYNKYISPEARFYRPMTTPAINKLKRDELFSDSTKKFSYENTGSVVSSSGDLAYTYGKTGIELHSNAGTRSLNGNYLRIWKRESDNVWRIVLDLVNVAR